jgi:hypothetical protein
MTSIQQSITFAGATPEALFDLYLDSKKHTAATGGVAVLGKKVGDRFTAWDGPPTRRT